MRLQAASWNGTNNQGKVFSWLRPVFDPHGSSAVSAERDPLTRPSFVSLVLVLEERDPLPRFLDGFVDLKPEIQLKFTPILSFVVFVIFLMTNTVVYNAGRNIVHMVLCNGWLSYLPRKFYAGPKTCTLVRDTQTPASKHSQIWPQVDFCVQKAVAFKPIRETGLRAYHCRLSSRFNNVGIFSDNLCDNSNARWGKYSYICWCLWNGIFLVFSLLCRIHCCFCKKE